MNYACLQFILIQMSPTHQENSQTCALIIKFSHLWYFANFPSLKTQSFTDFWYCYDDSIPAKAGRPVLHNILLA